jgi:hypothetical protein
MANKPVHGKKHGKELKKAKGLQKTRTLKATTSFLKIDGVAGESSNREHKDN